ERREIWQGAHAEACLGRADAPQRVRPAEGRRPQPTRDDALLSTARGFAVVGAIPGAYAVLVGREDRPGVRNCLALPAGEMLEPVVRAAQVREVGGFGRAAISP